ncbi:MAG: YkgJ family cysteine cluster protein [Planctomycetota bacterium]|nr:MAG: YkgJ family cysteine cluster protein [Planctomycetota bacterium]
MALASVRALHAAVDRAARPLLAAHAERLACRRGCSDCCRDGLTVFEVEALRLLHDAREALDAGPGPEGACAFLDEEGACRAYAARPYVCRTQGLPLRWLEERAGELVELRDVCPLNDPPGALPVEELEARACWTLGPYEERLAAIQRTHFGSLRRVSLRSLFEERGPGLPARP